jgi:hypothetical protein
MWTEFWRYGLTRMTLHSDRLVQKSFQLKWISYEMNKMQYYFSPIELLYQWTTCDINTRLAFVECQAMYIMSDLNL